MKKRYAINNLIIGDTISIVPIGRSSILCEKQYGRFIFEKRGSLIPWSSETRYIEIFTEIEKKLYNNNFCDDVFCANFNTAYIINEEDIKGYFTAQEIANGFVSSTRLVQVYNEINISMEKALTKVKK